NLETILMPPVKPFLPLEKSWTGKKQVVSYTLPGGTTHTVTLHLDKTGTKGLFGDLVSQLDPLLTTNVGWGCERKPEVVLELVMTICYQRTIDLSITHPFSIFVELPLAHSRTRNINADQVGINAAFAKLAVPLSHTTRIGIVNLAKPSGYFEDNNDDDEDWVQRTEWDGCTLAQSERVRRHGGGSIQDCYAPYLAGSSSPTSQLPPIELPKEAIFPAAGSIFNYPVGPAGSRGDIFMYMDILQRLRRGIPRDPPQLCIDYRLGGVIEAAMISGLKVIAFTSSERDHLAAVDYITRVEPRLSACRHRGETFVDADEEFSRSRGERPAQSNVGCLGESRQQAMEACVVCGTAWHRACRTQMMDRVIRSKKTGGLKGNEKHYCSAECHAIGTMWVPNQIDSIFKGSGIERRVKVAVVDDDETQEEVLVRDTGAL
ncbi:hypothetical protein BDK51DRAFT_32079, partial [Blyttiomyces helicus]